MHILLLNFQIDPHPFYVAKMFMAALTTFAFSALFPENIFNFSLYSI